MVRIRTSHSSWLAKRCWVVHTSGGGAAWCVSDCSVKKGWVCGVIGRSVVSLERNKTAWCFLAPHHRENSQKRDASRGSRNVTSHAGDIW